MRSFLYMYFDVKVEQFFSLFTEKSDDAAARGFEYSFKNNDGLMSAYPADFALYRVGEIDANTGIIDSCAPKLICTGLSATERK